MKKLMLLVIVVTLISCSVSNNGVKRAIEKETSLTFDATIRSEKSIIYRSKVTYDQNKEYEKKIKFTIDKYLNTLPINDQKGSYSEQYTWETSKIKVQYYCELTETGISFEICCDEK